LKIGVDLRCLQGHSKYRGIGKYVMHTISEMAKIDIKNNYVFYIFENENSPINSLGLPSNFKYEIKRVTKNKKNNMKHIGILFDEFVAVKVKEDFLDVFFQPDISYGIPKGVKVVSTFHDLIPYYFWKKPGIKNNEGVKLLKIKMADQILKRKYINSLKKYKLADSIIAISDSSRNDFIKYFGTEYKSKIKVVYDGVNCINSKNINTTNKIGNYILYVGGVDIRKNIVGLAKTFFSLKSDTKYEKLKLVLVGKEFDNKQELNDIGWFDTIKKSKYRNDIVITGYLDDDKLLSIYKNAKAFVFPSLYEGFGLPVLEAMNMGAPVVAFNNSSIPEVAGDAAILCDNQDEFESGLKKLLEDEKFRQSLIEKGYRQVKKFSWQKTAKETLKVIEDLGKEKG
jgi:glycosyltransferase involved in cell wall biosynthesis